MSILQGLKNTIYVDKNLSEYYYQTGNYDLSIEYTNKILETCLNIKSLAETEERDSQILINQEIENLIKYANQRLVSLHYFYAEDCLRKKLYEKAINLYKHVLLNTNDKDLIFNKIGICFKNLGQIDSAIFFFENSLCVPDSHRELGDIYYHQKNDLLKSINSYEQFIKTNQKNSLVYNMLGHLYNKTGEIEKSYENLVKANQLSPENKMIISNLLFTLQKIPNKTQKEIYDISKNCINEYLEHKKIEQYIHDKSKRESNSKLHIGYISGDFNDHVIMLYLLAILEHHNKDKFIISCYSNTPEQDEDVFSLRAELFSDNFKNISKNSDSEVAEIIFNDKVDILIDLAGHTSRSRTFVLLHKPAPVQISYMGFPNTTGIETVDYFLSNENLNDESENEYYSEQIYFLDSCYRCFKHSVEVFPEISESALSQNSYFTFGVFNDLSKINDEVIETWSEILKSVPDSKILICRTTIIEEFLLSKFEKFGINHSRIIFDKEFALDKYNLVDLHLDTFPYSGVTVIFDSAIMGIPTLTLKGETFAGKEAANINQYLGLNDFITQNKKDYISKAIELSKNKDRLQYLKNNLRNIYQNSVFADYQEFTQLMENAYQDIWNKYL